MFREGRPISRASRFSSTSHISYSMFFSREFSPRRRSASSRFSLEYRRFSLGLSQARFHLPPPGSSREVWQKGTFTRRAVLRGQLSDCLWGSPCPLWSLHWCFPPTAAGFL